MQTSDSPHWYAVYTRPNMERKLTAELLEKGIVAYCPIQKVMRQWSDRKKVIEVPAFRGYVFVQIHDKIRWHVLTANGVLNFVCHNGKPARIPNSEMETVRLFFQDMETCVLDETDISVNDIARVYSGVLMGMEGEVVDLKHRYVILKIPALGLQMQVKVPRENIQVIKKGKAI
jgi:transcription antitermination factor NusG